MSDALYLTRLRWSHGHGLAAHAGVTVVLSERPPVLLHELRLVELEYAPAVGIQYLQTAVDPRRDLTPAEAAELMAYLEQVALGGNDAARRRVVWAAKRAPRGP